MVFIRQTLYKAEQLPVLLETLLTELRHGCTVVRLGVEPCIGRVTIRQ